MKQPASTSKTVFHRRESVLVFSKRKLWYFLSDMELTWTTIYRRISPCHGISRVVFIRRNQMTMERSRRATHGVNIRSSKTLTVGLRVTVTALGGRHVPVLALNALPDVLSRARTAVESCKYGRVVTKDLLDWLPTNRSFVAIFQCLTPLHPLLQVIAVVDPLLLYAVRLLDRTAFSIQKRIEFFSLFSRVSFLP